MSFYEIIGSILSLSNSRKCPYPARGRSLVIVGGEVGVLHSDTLRGKYEAELEFPEGQGRFLINPPPLPREGGD